MIDTPDEATGDSDGAKAGEVVLDKNPTTNPLAKYIALNKTVVDHANDPTTYF